MQGASLHLGAATRHLPLKARCFPTTKACAWVKHFLVKAACRSNSNYMGSTAPETVHRALLALHEVLAKYNAVIRVNFPPSHPVTRVMERNTSCWANDAPFAIQAFKHAAEDAL